VTRPIDPVAIAVLVAQRLDRLGILHTTGGSIASSLAGEPRTTIDIDIVAAIDERHVSAIVDAFSRDFYIDEQALRRAVREHASTNLIHQPSQIKVDIHVAGGTPLDLQQIGRRRAVEVAPGQILYVHPPEDILLQKLRWYRKGGEVSDRQWRDIVSIVRVQGERLDRAYLERNAPILDVAGLLARALDQA
jgi:hypothetical protein